MERGRSWQYAIGGIKSPTLKEHHSDAYKGPLDVFLTE